MVPSVSIDVVLTIELAAITESSLDHLRRFGDVSAVTQLRMKEFVPRIRCMSITLGIAVRNEHYRIESVMSLLIHSMNLSVVFNQTSYQLLAFFFSSELPLFYEQVSNYNY